MAKQNFNEKQITEKEVVDAAKTVQNYLKSDGADKALKKQAQSAQRVITQCARQREKEVAAHRKASRGK